MFYIKHLGKVLAGERWKQPSRQNSHGGSWQHQGHPHIHVLRELFNSLGCAQVNNVPNLPNPGCDHYYHSENAKKNSIFQHITPRGAAKNTSKHTFTAPTSFPVSYNSWDLGRKSKSDVCSKLDHSCLWNRKILDLHAFSAVWFSQSF